MYLIHFPISLKFVPFEQKYPGEWVHPDDGKMVPDHGVTYEETWHAMEDLVDKKLVKDIGVSNVMSSKIVDILKYCRIKPSVLQIELHPFLTQRTLTRFVKEHCGMHIMGFSTFGNASYIELGMATKEDTPFLCDAITEPAKKYSKTPAQICLRFQVQQGHVVIPKSSKEERLRENMDIFDFELTSDEMEAIFALNKNKRYNDPGVFAEGAFGCFYPIYD